MKKYTPLCLFLLLAAQILSACKPTSSPAPIASHSQMPTGTAATATLTPPPTPTRRPTRTPTQPLFTRMPSPTQRPTEKLTAADSAYFHKLTEMVVDNEICCPAYDLSPDGQWLAAAPAPFVLGQDDVEFLSMDDDLVVIREPVDNAFLGLPLDKIPNGTIATINSRSPGSFSSDRNTWSPDNTVFLGLGPAYQFSPFTFLVIFDISDPADIRKTLLKWDYPGEPFTAWAPDSSQFLIWFGEEVEMGKSFAGIVYEDVAWLVDRSGTTLNKFDISGYRSPIWVNDQILMLKGENEIWQLDPLTGQVEKWHTSDHPIDKILDLNAENTQLLLLESVPPYDFLILDVTTHQMVTRAPSLLNEWDLGGEVYAISSPSHYSGIQTGHFLFYIFDWETHTTQAWGNCLLPFWSSVLDGFVLQMFGRLELIRP
ncbi:MAG TPA: hypothetical protein PKG95_01865 [Anaerolineaceae bacterium]|nr:hypothetical protein [Anaerolineaceae bacterium]